MILEIPKGDFAGYIFDCDGTLADTMPLHYRAWARAVEEDGGHFPQELFYRWGGRPSATIVEDLNRTFGHAFAVEAMVDRKESYYLDLIHEVQPLERVVEIARSLHGTAPLAVASGGYRKYVEITLEVIGLKELFDAIVCAEDYEQGKPAPDAFLEAARRLDVRPSECLVFEDSPAGVQAAANAGMQCVFVPSTQTLIQKP